MKNAEKTFDLNAKFRRTDPKPQNVNTYKYWLNADEKADKNI